MKPLPEPSSPFETTKIEFSDDVGRSVSALVETHALDGKPLGALEKALDAIRIVVANARFILGVVIAALIWIAVNTILTFVTKNAFDPPPFFWLQGCISFLAMCTTIIIISTQKREDEIAKNRERLTLELAVTSEQKIAKIIELLETLRRDSPHIADRVDREAGEMARPADPVEVLTTLAKKAD